MPARTTTPDPGPDRAALQALADKYRRLIALRVSRDAGGTPPPAVLRALATEFPGCLRELDRAGLAELRRRQRALRGALRPTRVAPLPAWLLWISDYHRLLAAALRLRQPSRPSTPGLVLSAAFKRHARRPPGGRLSAFVLAEVADRHGADRELVARTLFPPRGARYLGISQLSVAAARR